MSRGSFCALVAAVAVTVLAAAANAAVINWQYDFTGASGLSARAVFHLDQAHPSVLGIELANTSTALPAGFDSADQILTGLSFDLQTASIVGGQVYIAPGGRSINFGRVDTQLAAGDDISGEWGYGNFGTDGMMPNVVSSKTARMTPFGGEDLTGPPGLGGPDAGLVTDGPLMHLGGLGAVAGPVTITLQLDRPLDDLGFLSRGATAEFGSGAAFLSIPEPATVVLIGAMGVLALARRPRRRVQ